MRLIALGVMIVAAWWAVLVQSDARAQGVRAAAPHLRLMKPPSRLWPRPRSRKWSNCTV